MERIKVSENSISRIVEQWENQSEWGDDVRLYVRFVKYFGLLNKGWKGKEHEIFIMEDCFILMSCWIS